MLLQEKNYWLTTVSEPIKNTSSSLPENIDVAIVGAGLTGLSSALALARQGKKVAVFDAEDIGWGASSRNGGMVLTGLKLPFSTLVSRYGHEAARNMYMASLLAIDCVEKLVQQEKIDCNFSRSGHLEVACKQAHFDDFAHYAKMVKDEFNHTLRIIPRDALEVEIGSDIYFGGMVDELSAGINPARFVSGVAQAANNAGVILLDHTPVQNIAKENETQKKKFRITTDKGELLAQDVILASGAYNTKATNVLRKKVIPIGSYIVATEVLSNELAHELSPRNRMIYDSKNFLYYYRLTPDNRLLFGGRAAFFPETKNTIRQSAEILYKGILEVYPQLKDYDIEYVWGGTIDMTFDVMPHLGQIDDMYYAIGFAGHGVALATYFGTKLADIMCGYENDLAFYNIPFSNAPYGLRTGHTWALPLAEIYYRYLDLVS